MQVAVQTVSDQGVFSAPGIKRLVRNSGHDRSEGTGAFRELVEHGELFVAIAVAADEQERDVSITHLFGAQQSNVVRPQVPTPCLRSQLQVVDDASYGGEALPRRPAVARVGASDIAF